MSISEILFTYSFTHLHNPLTPTGAIRKKHPMPVQVKIRIHNTASPLVYSNMGWLGDGSDRGQVCQARMAVGLLPRYPQCPDVKNYKGQLNPVWHRMLIAVPIRQQWASKGYLMYKKYKKTTESWLVQQFLAHSPFLAWQLSYKITFLLLHRYADVSVLVSVDGVDDLIAPTHLYLDDRVLQVRDTRVNLCWQAAVGGDVTAQLLHARQQRLNLLAYHLSVTSK